MKLLVTGGAGFIGSNFIRLILRKYPSYKVINLDKLNYSGNPENLKDFSGNRNYRLVSGDICDPKITAKLMRDVDAVVNFAAETHVDRSILDPDAFIRTNVFGVYNLLETAKKCGVPRFVHISTDEVYGSISKGSFTERSPLMPNSPYSASKAAGDLLARSYYVTYKLPVIITRSSNNFGPYQFPEKVIPLFITNAIEGKQLPLYGKGNNVRDWLYVEDNCLAIDRILHNGKIGEVYNIGGDQELANIELTRSILRYMSLPPTFIKNVPDRLGHDLRYSLDSSKIRKQLGWKPKLDFKHAILDTIDWYKENTSWWKNIKNKTYMKYYKKQYKSLA